MKRIFEFLLLSVFLFSCSDSIDSHGSNFLLTEKPYILKGSVKSSDKEELSGRMAIPATPVLADYISDINNYKFKVSHNGDPKNGVTFDNSGNFSLQLNTGDNEIKIEVEKKVESSPVDWITILRSTETITIGANSPHVLSKNFVLKKLQTEGKKGNVKLEINCSNAGVDYVTATLVETDPTKISNWQNALGIDDGTLISEAGVNGTLVTFPSGDAPLSINSGSYRVKFDFYDNYDNKNILYSRIQTIEVYDGLLTDKWYEAGVDQPGPVETFTVNGEAVSAFVNATVYVDPVNGDDDNGGSYYGKFKTLQKALNTVDARNKKVSGEEFNIFLSGDFTDQDPVFLNQESGVLKLNIKSDSDTQRVISGTAGNNSALFKINGKAADNTIINLENIRITGQTNTSDTDNGGGIYVKRATLTLTKCTIDSNSANKGGGIYIDSGIVKLGNGSKITGNTATDSGGGVYNKGNFFMYGSSLIGDSATSTTLASDSSGGYANKAETGGGIYNNGGNVYIGYDSAEHEYPIEADTNTWYGIRRNFSTANGAGIYHQSGTLKIASGDISYNYVNSNDPSFSCYGGAVYLAAGATVSGGTFTGNKAKNGGAFYISSGKTLTIDGNAVIKKNTAEYEGGGICNLGTLTMAAGTIGGSGAQNTAGESGGAVYQSGTFIMRGSANVYGTRLEKSNDVFLPSGKYITIDKDTFTGSASITPVSWNRGKQVLDGSKASSFITKFSLIDDEWHVVSDNSVGKLDTEDGKIYVSESKWNNATGYYTGDDTTGRGTKTRPYATIQMAAKETWRNLAYTIYVNGTLKATSTDTLQSIPNDTKVKASSITLSGSNSATINADSKGTALTISKAIPVTITNIKITGGNATNGGGILVNGVKAANLTLTTGALITANTATKSGGGIYFAGTNATGGTANLIMNDTAKIDGNTASGTGSNEGGGGVYLSYANLCMSGKSVIGDTSGSAAATSASTGHSNTGNYGGGVYAYKGGNVYVGYKTTGTTDNAYTTSYGILHNYSSRGGGGINVSDNAKLYLAYGSISKNGAGDSGGAVTIQTSGSMTMSGGAMALNSGVAGGAVAVVGTFEMTGGTIGNASKSTPATGATACSNYASSSTLGGGAIWAIAGSTVTVTDGTIAYNYAAGNGGAIHASGESGKTTTINLGGGSVYANAAVKNGGGVYNGSYSSLFMYSSALIGKVDGVSSAASSATACSNTAVYGGGIYNDSGSVYLGYKTTSSTNDLSGGVCYNYATGSDSEDATGGGGGGISSVGGTVLIRAGNVSYNGCVDGGGGLYLKNGSNYKITGGEIKSNKAQTGGGLYVYSGEVSMSGGKFVSNVLTGTAAGNMGGAVFLLPGGPGVFKMSGTAYLPCTGQRENDICFAGNNDGTSKLIVTGKLTLPSGATTTKVARLTGANASRVLFDYTGTDSTFVKEANKFDVSYLSNTSYIIYSDGKLKKGGDATAALTSIEGATGGLTTVVINDSVSTGQLASLKAMMESQAASYPSAYIALDFTMADINSFVFGVKGSTSPANLRKVTLPKNCTVADYAFYSCTGLTTVVIPDGTTLSGHSFTKCSSLEELDLSNISASSNLREMCNGCTSLREITLPKSFDTSQDSLTRTFKDCTSLTTINYKGTIAEWNSAITNASELKMNVTTTITVKCTNGNTTL